jgi:hypothetical protein
LVRCYLSDEAADMPVRLLDDIAWDGEALLVTRNARPDGLILIKAPRLTILKLACYGLP